VYWFEQFRLFISILINIKLVRVVSIIGFMSARLSWSVQFLVLLVPLVRVVQMTFLVNGFVGYLSSVRSLAPTGSIVSLSGL